MLRSVAIIHRNDETLHRIRPRATRGIRRIEIARDPTAAVKKDKDGQIFFSAWIVQPKRDGAIWSRNFHVLHPRNLFACAQLGEANGLFARLLFRYSSMGRDPAASRAARYAWASGWRGIGYSFGTRL